MAGLATLFLLTPLVASVGRSVAPPPGSAAIPAIAVDDEHQARAERWLKRHGRELDDDQTFEQVLADEFARLPLGVFEVRVSGRYLGNDRWLADLKEASLALVRLQMEWIEWLPGGQREDIAVADIIAGTKTISSWIKSWKKRNFDDTTSDVLDATNAKPKVRDAVALFAEYMCGGGPLVTRKHPYSPAPLFFIPDRADFVEFIAVAGLLAPRHRPFVWTTGPEVWTEFDFDDMRAICFEHATLHAARDYRQSSSMSHRNPSGIEQHVVQLATRSLLDTCFRTRMEPMLAAGIASNMVIALYGEVDTRTDGDVRSRESQARSVFVPGGNSSGGSLPPTDANSRWREDKGKGYFVGVLRRAQKAAARNADERWKKTGTFLLFSDNQSKSRAFEAPFLGAGVTDIPEEDFRGDYAEFVRAYRAAFLHWLRERGAGSKNDSQGRYAALLRAIATQKDPLSDVFLQTYGAALSAASGRELFEGEGTSSLEAMFLTWLSKQ